MTQLLLVACGGAAGSLLRYVAAGWGLRLAGGAFPLGTLLVNVSGCLLIGGLGALFSGPLALREDLRVAVLVGFLGGYTTFSSFGYETFALLEDGDWRAAAVYVLATNTLGLLALWIGHRSVPHGLGS